MSRSAASSRCDLGGDVDGQRMMLRCVPLLGLDVEPAMVDPFSVVPGPLAGIETQLVEVG